MATATQNASMTSGDSLEAAVTITDDDGASVSLTDASVSYVIADSRRGSTHVTKTVGSGIALSSNVATVTLDPSDTSALSGVYYHEMQVTDTNGNVSTVFSGTLTITADAVT